MRDATSTPKAKAPLAVAGVLLVAAAVIAVNAWRLQQPVMEAGLGARAFPLLIAAGLAVLGGLTARTAFVAPGPNLGIPNVKPMLGIAGGLLAQILLLRWTGFVVATAVLFCIAARAFGARPLPLVILVAFVVSLAAYVAFRFGLQLHLPEGPLEKLL